MESYRITNVKVSIKTSEIILDNVVYDETCMKRYKNFLVIKSQYTYIIFKTNKKKNVTHINITKIPSISDINNSILFLKTIIDFEVYNTTVDNIIATFKHFDCLNLWTICEKELFKCIKYNNESFPGLFVSTDQGTAILFSTGSIILVGCKKEKDLDILYDHIKQTLKNAEC